MATLLPEIRLKIPNPKGLLSGIESSDGRDNVLITHDHKYIMIYNVADQKIVKDWTVRGQNLISAAVCHHEPQEPQKFSVVCRKSVIRTWSASDINVEKAEKTSAISEVHRLWTPSGRGMPYIIHTDGSCASLDDCESLVIQPQTQAESRIVWSGHTSDINHVLVLIIKDKNELYSLMYKWNKDNNSTGCTKCPLSSSDQEVKDFSVSGNCTSKVYLFTLLHDGKQNYIVERNCVYDKKNTDICHREVFRIKDMADCSGFCVLDEDQITVSGKNTALKKHGLSVWDLKFGFERQFCCLDVLLKNSAIYTVGDFIFVSTAGGHYALPVVRSSTTLASAFGQLHSKSQVFSGKQGKRKIVPDSARVCLVNLADSQKTATEESFVNELKQFFELETSLDENQMLILATDIGKIVQRLARVDFHIETDILERLIVCKSLQGDVLLTLIPYLQKHGEVEVIHKALSTLTDIPEASLVQALSYYLKTFNFVEQADNVELSDTKDGTADETNSSKLLFSQRDSAKINHLLSLPYNDVFLVECLGDLNFESVLSLLKHLVYLLIGISDSPKAAKDEDKPSLEQVVSWMNAIFDAHFAQIVLSPDCREVLLDLQKTVDEQVQFYEELVSLESLLYQLRQNVILPTKQNVGQYCIQTLHVR